MSTSLADHLRTLPDESLADLLRLRPDLVVPVPADFAALALRAQSRASVARALDRLDQFHLLVLDAVRLTRDPRTHTTSVRTVLEIATGKPYRIESATVRAALERLRALLLVPGPDGELRVAPGADEVCGPYPAGLGRPAADLDATAGALCADAPRLRRTLLAAAPSARAILDRLAAGPPVGTLPTAALRAVPAGSEADLPADLTNGGSPTGSPVRWLVDHGLLVAIGAGENGGTLVELPRELGLLLRRDTGPLGPLEPAPPPVLSPAREPKAVDSAGAGQVMEAVRHAEAVLENLATDPPAVLRSGGIGIRDLRRLARDTGLDEGSAALLLEICQAAGLVAEVELHQAMVTRGGPELQVMPTAGYELWRGLSMARRWDQLIRAWLVMPRQAGLVGHRDERDRLITPLSPEVERAGAPSARRTVLTVLAELAPGGTASAEEVLRRVEWAAPRRSRHRAAMHREVLAEAATLGLTGLGALTSYGRLLLAEEVAAADTEPREDPLGRGFFDEGEAGSLQALDALLPAPVDHFLIQADLSVVVPGPPEPDLAAELETIAERESAGGASVHRVTTASVRRALDTGYTAQDLHELFARRSRTPIPQGLTYLIDDMARRHGGLRVGSAGAYVRSDDEALLTEVLADRRLESLALRRLAPTVLVTPLQLHRMLTGLREAGYAPVQEDAGGAAVLVRPKARRAPARGPVAGRVVDPLAAPRLSRPRLLGAVEQIRRGDAVTQAARRAKEKITPKRTGDTDLPAGAPTNHSEALAVLQQAIRDKALVWVGYVDAHGATASRLVRPVSIGAGYLRAEDERTEMLHTFALSRITTAVPDR